ncbi:hypothetical protein ACJX0J_032130, partial [Zea mays]
LDARLSWHVLNFFFVISRRNNNFIGSKASQGFWLEFTSHNMLVGFPGCFVLYTYFKTSITTRAFKILEKCLKTGKDTAKASPYSYYFLFYSRNLFVAWQFIVRILIREDQHRKDNGFINHIFLRKFYFKGKLKNKIHMETKLNFDTNWTTQSNVTEKNENEALYSLLIIAI